ncbi:hypothetical protein ACLB1R_26775 [Escherichia coli]
MINGMVFERQEAKFVQDNPDAELHPCYVAIKNVLATYGIKVDAIKSRRMLMTKHA